MFGVAYGHVGDDLVRTNKKHWEANMLDHIGFVVKDLAASRAFYTACLKPLGAGPQMEVGLAETSGTYEGIGFGKPGKPSFWLSSTHGGAPLSGRLHVAFVAASRAEVDAFYAEAMAAGGIDNGPPGLRPHYHPNYYGAFVFDPDGHNVEAVCHLPE
jgi:catechol 2,3-dioxygenase-like lactoylglutathione lyase family enzyme